MTRHARFSMQVKGSGFLVNMFITEACVHFPNATIFDQSNRTTATRWPEAAFRKRFGTTPAHRASTQRLVHSLESPVVTYITVTFSTVDDREQVTIGARGRQRTLKRSQKADTVQDLEHFIRRVLRVIKRLG
jgi:hypothetical protein